MKHIGFACALSVNECVLSQLLPYAKAISSMSAVVKSDDGFWRRWYDNALSSGTDLRF